MKITGEEGGCCHKKIESVVTEFSEAHKSNAKVFLQKTVTTTSRRSIDRWFKIRSSFVSIHIGFNLIKPITRLKICPGSECMAPVNAQPGDHTK